VTASKSGVIYLKIIVYTHPFHDERIEPETNRQTKEQAECITLEMQAFRCKIEQVQVYRLISCKQVKKPEAFLGNNPLSDIPVLSTIIGRRGIF
jgi:hypothetical protein